VARVATRKRGIPCLPLCLYQDIFTGPIPLTAGQRACRGTSRLRGAHSLLPCCTRHRCTRLRLCRHSSPRVARSPLAPPLFTRAAGWATVLPLSVHSHEGGALCTRICRSASSVVHIPAWREWFWHARHFLFHCMDGGKFSLFHRTACHNSYLPSHLPLTATSPSLCLSSSSLPACPPSHHSITLAVFGQCPWWPSMPAVAPASWDDSSALQHEENRQG